VTFNASSETDLGSCSVWRFNVLAIRVRSNVSQEANPHLRASAQPPGAVACTADLRSARMRCNSKPRAMRALAQFTDAIFWTP